MGRAEARQSVLQCKTVAAGGIHFRRGLKFMRGDPAKCPAILRGVQKQLDELHIALVGQLEE